MVSKCRCSVFSIPIEIPTIQVTLNFDAASQKSSNDFHDSGQACLDGVRLLVKQPIKDDFLEKFSHAQGNGPKGGQRVLEFHADF